MAAAFTTPTCAPLELLVKAGLQARVLLPADADYAARQESYWSNSAKIRPACIVRPRTADEVAVTVRVLATAGEQFAIRSGGHMHHAGANNINGGTTIDLGLLEWTRYNAADETVDIGPGGRWREVYAELEKHGRTVAGGREGGVGIAGLILGGGNSYVTARQGFACDNVIAYEVVLADGRIITADATVHADLFRALKGGSLNFGVVTNFKMKAIKSDRVWGGLAFFPKSIMLDASQALVEFTDHLGDDRDSNLLCFFTYMGTCRVAMDDLHLNDPDFQDTLIAAMYVHIGGVEKAPSYKRWLAFPEVTTTYKHTSFAELAQDYNLPLQYRNIWFTATFKNDARIVARAAEVHETLVEELRGLIPDGDFITQCLFQPLPTFFAQRSEEAGGNMLGLQRQQHNGLLWLAAVMVRTPEQEVIAREKTKAWVQAVQDFASTIDGGNQEWIYLNYADPSQDPLSSYGPDNAAKLKAVAATYDPERVFQTLCRGGFRLSSSLGIGDAL